MNKKILFLFFGLFIIHNSIFAMDDTPLKNKKIQNFEDNCQDLNPKQFQAVIEIDSSISKYYSMNEFSPNLASTEFCAFGMTIHSTGIAYKHKRFARPLNIPIIKKDLTELLIYTEKLKILLQQAKERNK